MKVCVISDLHYKYAAHKAEDVEQNAKALAFLRSLPGQFDWLVLNGDIFDLWFDWHSVIIRDYFPVLKALADIREKGCRLVYISGNHDFWFNDFLVNQLQADIYPDAFVLELDRKKLYFTHGDLHTTNDLRYQFFRRFIRLPFAKWLFSILHPDFALWLGKLCSRTSRSRKVSAKLQERKKAGLEAYARSLLNEYDYVIMGHTHEPCLIPLEKGIYANSGDWLTNNSYITVIDGEISLRTS